MIKTIKLQNFLSYKEAEFTVHRGQLNVVIGDSDSDYADSNASGKTSLLRALLWTLYGQFPDQEGADSVVNAKIKKDTCVEVEFEKNNVQYRIVRYRKHKEHKNNIFIFSNNQMTSGDAKEIQSKINDILGITYDVFLSTLVFTGDKAHEFAGGTDKDQKKILTAILPSLVENINNKVKDKLKPLEEKFSDLSTKHHYINNRIKELEEELSTKTTDDHDYMNLENDRKEVVSIEGRIVTKKEELDKAKATLDLHNAKTEQDEEVELQKLKQEEQKELAGRLTELQNLLNRKQQFEIELKNNLDDQTDCRVEAQARLESIKNEINSFTTQDEHECPTCGQDVKNEALQRTRQTLEAKYDSEENKFLDKMSRLEAKESELQHRIEEIDVDENELEAKRDSLAALSEELEVLYSKMRSKGQETVRFNKELQDLRFELQTLESSKEKLLFKIKEVELKIQLEKDQKAKYTKELNNKHEEAKTLAQELEKLQSEIYIWKQVDFLYSGSKGSLQHFVFEQMLPELTATTQMFLNFFSENTLKVTFKSHRIKGKNVLEGFFVEAERGDVKGYGNLSRGEQRRINVSINLALYIIAGKNTFNPGILFLDEVADSLDQSGKQNIIQVLEHFCNNYDVACVLLTNERELMAHVQRGYICTMRKGLTTLKSI